ncbi:hypothetical protein G7046_g8341 [Stylonectria norvegica]|nr:hypothetical protein G7046_g8341 [Stylonectria norvegica]
MCTLTYFEHKTCKHIWAVVTTPCAPWMGFNNCPSFCDGTAKQPPKYIRTKTSACPRCDLGGMYDRNALYSATSRATHTQEFLSRSVEAFTTENVKPSCPHAKMLPTPDTSHVPYERVYEPSEDSYLLLDTLSSPAEKAFLHDAFRDVVPLVVEVGTGSGVVLAFVHAHAQILFGHRHILAAGVDMNAFACRATVATMQKAQTNNPGTHGLYLGSCMGDLVTPWREGAVDVLIFNPPYVPTPEMPSRPEAFALDDLASRAEPSFDDDSYLLSLSYAGGRDGMETTDRLVDALPRILSQRGCAYVLFCAQNHPDVVRRRIEAFGPEWRALTVGSSGNQAGWEKLQIVRIWRDSTAAVEV